jgi:hypothetical protein
MAGRQAGRQASRQAGRQAGTLAKLAGEDDLVFLQGLDGLEGEGNEHEVRSGEIARVVAGTDLQKSE